MAKIFGYKKSNVEFKKGYIEDLESLGIEDETIDVVISNCVINLSPFKEEVFKGYVNNFVYQGYVNNFVYQPKS